MTGRHMMRRQRATVRASVGLGLVCALVGSGVAQARSLDVTEYASLHLVRRSGSVLYERGTATGTLPGTVTATFDVKVTKVTGSVTFYPRGGGSLTMNIVGYAKSAGTNPKFEGSLAIRRGTGKYARAVGSGTFSGTVNRRSWDATVTARARITY